MSQGRLSALTLASLAVALFFNLVFEHTLTRIVGVAGIFAFIVSGVFLIAAPTFIAVDDEEHGRAAPPGGAP
jgi:hypothetical protein